MVADAGNVGHDPYARSWLIDGIDLPGCRKPGSSFSPKKERRQGFASLPSVVSADIMLVLLPKGLRQLGLSQISQPAERSAIPCGDVGQHLAIHLNVGLLQPVDKTTIAQAVQARCGVNAGDPKAAEIAFAVASIAKRIKEGFQHRFIGSAEEF
jgi:hypothetical protein